jgi:LysR family transcriptional regulator, flagellar master operon regulator
MDIHLLRTFIEVHRQRNFGEAAKSLFVTQAAVSARIKQLEALLGVRLFERSARFVRPTAEGNRFLHHADRMVAAWRQALLSLSRAGPGAHQLSIAGSQRLWDVFLQEGWFHALRRAKPDWVVWAETGPMEWLLPRLFEGLVDVVVTLEPPRVELLDTVLLTCIDLVLVSTTPEQTPDQAMGDGYVMVDWGQAFEIEHRRLFPDCPPVLTQVSHFGMALNYLTALGGAAFLPGRVVHAAVQAGHLHPVLGVPVVGRDVYAISLSRNPKEALIREALALIEPGQRSPLGQTSVAVNEPRMSY